MPKEARYLPSIPPNATLLQAAALYVENGFAIVPTKGGKHAGSLLGKGWPEKSLRTRDDVLRVFSHAEDGWCIGLHMGASGTIAIDVDSPEQLGELGELLEASGAPFQHTRQGTGNQLHNEQRGHWLFCVPEGVSFTNASYPWGDVRCGNAIIIVEPSPHPKAAEGGCYRWAWTGELPELPAEIAALLKQQGPRGDGELVPVGNGDVTAFLGAILSDQRRYGSHELCPEVRAELFGALQTIGVEGQRHNTMRDTVLRLLSLAADGHIGVGRALEKVRNEYLAVQEDAPEADFQAAVASAAEKIIAANGAKLPAQLDHCHLVDPEYYREAWERRIADDPDAAGELKEAQLGAALNYFRSAKTADGALAERIAEEAFAKCFRYTDAGGWLRWDGQRWEPVTQDVAVEHVRQWWLARMEALAELEREGHLDTANDDADRALKRAWASKGASHNKLLGLAKLVRGVASIRADYAQFQPRWWELPCRNGVVDLRTGVLAPHDPSKHRHQELAPVDYRPGAAHPDWDKALEAIGDDETREWLQRRFGQAVTGRPTPDDKILFLTGEGSNGKSVLVTAVRRALGPYAKSLSHNTLYRREGQHSTELTDLFGCRVALLEELPQKRELSVQTIKTLAGTESIRARKIAKDTFEWEASHSVFVTANYKPRLGETDDGTWRRLVRVDFPLKFVAEPQHADERRGDPGLRTRLKDGDGGQHEAILAWLVAGAVAWYQDGFGPLPAAVKASTEQWREAIDRVGQYINTFLEFDPERAISNTVLIKHYKLWEQAQGHDSRQLLIGTLVERIKSHPAARGHTIVANKQFRVTSPQLSEPQGLDPRVPDYYPPGAGSATGKAQCRATAGLKFKDEAVSQAGRVDGSPSTGAPSLPPDWFSTAGR